MPLSSTPSTTIRNAKLVRHLADIVSLATSPRTVNDEFDVLSFLQGSDYSFLGDCIGACAFTQRDVHAVVEIHTLAESSRLRIETDITGSKPCQYPSTPSQEEFSNAIVPKSIAVYFLAGCFTSLRAVARATLCPFLTEGTSLFDDCLEQNVHAIVEICVLAESIRLRIETPISGV